jgi:hypothetical protein
MGLELPADFKESLRSFNAQTIKSLPTHRLGVMEDKHAIQDHRDLTSDERVLLEWLLANGYEGASAFTSQLAQVKVVSRCACGCPTIDLAVGEKRERTAGPSTILADAVGYSPEGVKVDVILHVREGQLSELEVVSHDGTTAFALPNPEALQPY